MKLFKLVSSYFRSEPEQLVDMVIDSKQEVVSLYGAGQVGIEVSLLLKNKSISICNWYDKRAEVENLNILGYNIKRPESVDPEIDKFVLVCSFAYQSEILRFLEEKGFHPSQVAFL